MRSNYVHFGSPQFRLLSDKQIDELHLASLYIMEKTGVAFECQEALDLLAEAGADTSNPNRVKIPPHLVEQAISTAPKTITIYTRDGERAFVLDGMTPHFGGQVALEEYLDPHTQQRRYCYPSDMAEMARVVDALPNVEWVQNVAACPPLPGVITDKVSLLQILRHSSKPVACQILEVPNLLELLEVCAMIAGGEKELRDKPFFLGMCMPVTPLVQGGDALEKSLICAERGIPMTVFSGPMAGATTPATLAAVLAISIAEFLSHLLVIQLKKPGAPVIVGAQPSVMDMKTTIFSYGAPESAFLIAALAEICHRYRLPVFGTAGEVDADIIDAQAAAEATYSILFSALSGADFVHGIGEMNEGRQASPEFAVFGSEVIDMVKVAMGGIEINAETLPLDLIDRLGPRGTYLSEKHTLKHFRKFWVPTVFDRSVLKDRNTRRCADLLREKTLDILRNHQPRPLPEDVMKDLNKIEKGWLDQVGLKGYPEKPEA
jgi:trimethylamine--corrinoid protein Co-methyltransferase